MSDHNLCFWQDSIYPQQRPQSLDRDIETDVAIIGGGFTGLWTAYYLKQEAPDLKITILESRHCGFGASGRNGGWLMGNLAGEHHWLPKLPAAQQQQTIALITGIVEEVKRVCTKHALDIDLQHGGTLYSACRYPEQESIQRELLASLYASGYQEGDYQWLSPGELQQQLQVAPCYGGIFTPHTAAIHPGKLVSQLVDTLKSLGVSIYQNTPIEHLEPRQLRTVNHAIKADIIVNATEAYNLLQPKMRPYVLPIQSRVIATAPIAESVWQNVGLEQRQTFADASRLVNYGQRTADNRLVFGMRGDYRYGAKPQAEFSCPDKALSNIRHMIGELFPALDKVEITHHWGGSLGLSKDDTPYALFDPHSGIAQAGGYGGEGVGATNLMARTLCDMIFHKQTELSQAPWAHEGLAHKKLRRWEPEPLRWIGYNSIVKTLEIEENLCAKQQRPHWFRRIVTRFAGFLSRIFL
ncbi:NAD(P)/FAD-dependent oxidoreductase [Candidatus Pelagadaptatus aseana]|uniref:NAD(P)/FAD-dependent oxidoreductase n=1 Tax=Candidatus Pelagadaptatus aseana TaxID=3120508 RepID=UPI003C6EBFF2